MLQRLAFASLAAPMVLFVALLAIPGLDKPWGSFSFHFYVVSAASLLAAFACLVLVLSARSLRETRILFLALSFFALGMIFSVHGLQTPGIVFDEATAGLERSPWLATLAAGVFATLSVISVPRIVEQVKVRVPEAVFFAAVAAITLYFVITMAAPNWLEGFPTTSEWFQHLLTAVSVGLLVFAGVRYYQSYLFARLPAQLSVAVGLFFLAEAQVSLDFGTFWSYSWWLYHALFLAAFSTVLAGWTWELLRARDAGAIAEGIVMRDALSQLNRGRSADLVALAEQIENHDLETFRHVDRVAAFAYAIGEELGLSPARLRELVLAAQMHDVGKIGLPPYILQKAEPLAASEWKLITRHPVKGCEIIGRVPGLRDISRTIRHHHERFDGEGYPDGLKGEAIPLASRIIAVADTFDALTSERPYRPAMSKAEARRELQRVAGTQLDPQFVGLLLKLLDNGALTPKKPRKAPGERVPA